MSLSEYSRHRNVHRSHISRLASSGVLVLHRTARGKRLVDVARSDAILNDVPAVDEQPTHPAAAGQPARPSYAEARTIFMIYSAKLRRMEFEAASAKMLEREPVVRRIAEHLDACREGFAAMVDRVTPAVTAEKDVRKVRLLLREAIVAELHRLADLLGGRATASAPPEAK